MFNPFMTRRDTLKFFAFGGLSFSLPALELRASEKRGNERPKSFVLVWLSGGPSQLETWDPHPGTKIGGPTKAIDTSLKGVQIASNFERTADVLHNYSVIRSMTSKEGDHERGAYYMLSGYRPDPTVIHPSLGAVVTQTLPNSGLEIPAHVAIGDVNPQSFPRGGYLGDELDAFRVNNPGRGVPNMKARVSDERAKRRLDNLDVVSSAFRSRVGDRLDGTLHASNTERALEMMTSEQLKAFVIDDETEETKASYGDTRFGRSCLVARRLVETGVRAVQVTLGGFDTHANNFSFHDGKAKDLDPALAALTNDLVERDLFDSTVVLVMGEFGRTPKINALEGRDHWPTGFSCLVGGGGLKAGDVIGETDPTGEKTNPTDPVTVEQLYATILTQLGVNPTEEVMTSVGRPMKYADGEPLERLLSAT